MKLSESGIAATLCCLPHKSLQHYMYVSSVHSPLPTEWVPQWGLVCQESYWWRKIVLNYGDLAVTKWKLSDNERVALIYYIICKIESYIARRMQSSSEQSENILINIRKKFRAEGVKVSGIVSKCAKLDRNNDQSVHVDDLEDILQESLKESRLTRRELNHLFGLIIHDRRRGNVEYLRLYEVIEGKTRQVEEVERWYDPEADRSKMKRGSIGEYLESAACASEILNFKRLIAALEMYERSSGMKLKPTEDGFDVPIGPDITANLKFVLRK